MTRRNPQSMLQSGSAPRSFSAGDEICNIFSEPVNLRTSPGYLGKPSEDVIATVSNEPVLTVVDGPVQADSLTWWQVQTMAGAASLEDQPASGWIAVASPQGQRFLVWAVVRDLLSVATPYAGVRPLTQEWGTNAAFYQRFSYNGVPLRGHNGLDFGLPEGTELLATDHGEVIEIGYEANGFGNYIKLRHSWGESLYAHMSVISAQKNQVMAQEEVLGLSGNTGGSTGPHLHFSIRIFPCERSDGWGGFSDPMPFMDRSRMRFRGETRWPSLPEAFYLPSAMAEDQPGLARP